MDFSTLAKDIAAFLTPFLPYLLKAGEKATEAVGEQIGGAAWEHAKAMWAKLRPRIETRSCTGEAAQDLATWPKDADAQATFRLQLKKLFSEDAIFAEEMFRTWHTIPLNVRQSVIEVSSHSIAVDGDVSESTVSTGDGIAIQKGKYNIKIDHASGLAIGDNASVERGESS